MSFSFLKKLSQSIHNQFQKTFVDEKFPQRLDDAFQLSYVLYEGNHPNYEACHCPYHNYQHAVDVTECLAQLISQYIYHHPQNGIVITIPVFECAMVAALFHDIGFLRKKDQKLNNSFDDHEARGAEMTSNFLDKEQWSKQEVSLIQNLIRGTHPPLFKTIIQTAREQNNALLEFLMKAVRTADYLGQMGQADYIERLSLLYQEIKEACITNSITHSNIAYLSLEELLKATPQFWEDVFHQILKIECSSLYQYLADPFPNGPNKYLSTIQQHIAYLRKQYPEQCI